MSPLPRFAGVALIAATAILGLGPVARAAPDRAPAAAALDAEPLSLAGVLTIIHQAPELAQAESDLAVAAAEVEAAAGVDDVRLTATATAALGRAPTREPTRTGAGKRTRFSP